MMMMMLVMMMKLLLMLKFSFFSVLWSPCKMFEKWQQRGPPQMPGTMFLTLDIDCLFLLHTLLGPDSANMSEALEPIQFQLSEKWSVRNLWPPKNQPMVETFWTSFSTWTMRYWKVFPRFWDKLIFFFVGDISHHLPGKSIMTLVSYSITSIDKLDTLKYLETLENQSFCCGVLGPIGSYTSTKWIHFSESTYPKPWTMV